MDTHTDTADVKDILIGLAEKRIEQLNKELEQLATFVAVGKASTNGIRDVVDVEPDVAPVRRRRRMSKRARMAIGRATAASWARRRAAGKA